MGREERIVSGSISRGSPRRKGFKAPVEFDADHETSRGIHMTWGLYNRLSRIIRPADGHTVMLAADHGYFLGPTHKLEIPRKTLEPLLPYADAVMVTRGVVRTSIDPGSNVPIVLRVSGGASVLNEDLSNEKITTSMKEAVRLNASAVALSIFVGAAHEHDSLVNLGKLVDEGEEAGVPVLAVTAVGKELEKRDAEGSPRARQGREVEEVGAAHARRDVLRERRRANRGVAHAPHRPRRDPRPRQGIRHLRLRCDGVVPEAEGSARPRP